MISRPLGNGITSGFADATGDADGLALAGTSHDHASACAEIGDPDDDQPIMPITTVSASKTEIGQSRILQNGGLTRFFLPSAWLPYTQCLTMSRGRGYGWSV